MAHYFRNVRDRNDTLMVPMNQVKICRWSSTQRYLATQGLNGCTAVAVTSERVGVLAHIAPQTETATGTQNVLDLMQQFITLINNGRRHGLFATALSIVLAANYENDIALPEQIDIIKRALNRLALPVQLKEYSVRSFGQARAEGETHLVIDGHAGQRPQIYINDGLLEAQTEESAALEEGAAIITSSEAERAHLIRLRIEQARMGRDRLVAARTPYVRATERVLEMLAPSLGISKERAYALLRQNQE